MFGYTFKFDRDFIHKAAAAVIAAAASAALSAGLNTLVNTLSSDPKYAVWAVVVTTVVAAFSKKKPA